MEQTKYDVFISYSRKDTVIANKIADVFKKNGITFFIDRQGISGGLEFPAVLAKAIKESKVFLFLASKNSYGSKFTQSEIIYAFNKKDKNDIIPYIIDGSTFPEELEFTFSAINWRRINEHPIETTLIEDVFSRLGKERPKESTVQEKPSIFREKSIKRPYYKTKIWRFVLIGLLGVVILIATIVLWPNRSAGLNPKDDLSSITAPELKESEYGVEESDNKKNKEVVDKFFSNSILGTYHYSGEIGSSGMPEGKGRATFANGDFYDGEFSNGNIIKGRYTWVEDDAYFEGCFINNEPDEKKGFYYDKNGKKL